MVKKLLLLIWVPLILNAEYYFENGNKVELTKLSITTNRSGKTVTKYRNANGRIFELEDRIILQLKNINDLTKIVEKYDVEVLEEMNSGFVLIRVKDRENIFVISRELQNETFVNFAHPDFKRERRAR